MKIEERPWVKVFLVKSIRFLPDLLQLLLSTLHTHTHTHMHTGFYQVLRK